jgi:hypothetical protein
MHRAQEKEEEEEEEVHKLNDHDHQYSSPNSGSRGRRIRWGHNKPKPMPLTTHILTLGYYPNRSGLTIQCLLLGYTLQGMFFKRMRKKCCSTNLLGLG